MHEGELNEQLRFLQQEITLAGEAIATLKREQRAETDALRFEIALLRRCVLFFHPTLQEEWGKIRAAELQHLDPEAL